MEVTTADFAAAHGAEQNALLRALPLADYSRILPHLRPMRLTPKQVLNEAGATISDVYFPREGIVSLLATRQSGGPIEVGTIGREGFVGMPALLAAERTPFLTIVQVEGHAWRVDAAAFRAICEEYPEARRLFLRYAQYYADQTAQSVACNRLHTIDERCARWLLMTHDRVQGDTFALTHEFLAMMLGVRRAGVTVALGELQSADIVRSSRGAITIVDRGRLASASCDCYALMRARLTELLGAQTLDS